MHPFVLNGCCCYRLRTLFLTAPPQLLHVLFNDNNCRTLHFQRCHSISHYINHTNTTLQYIFQVSPNLLATFPHLQIHMKQACLAILVTMPTIKNQVFQALLLIIQLLLYKQNSEKYNYSTTPTKVTLPRSPTLPTPSCDGTLLTVSNICQTILQKSIVAHIHRPPFKQY